MDKASESVGVREVLREMFCPRPVNGKEFGLSVGECCDAGECGCVADAALSRTDEPRALLNEARAFIMQNTADLSMGSPAMDLCDRIEAAIGPARVADVVASPRSEDAIHNAAVKECMAWHEKEALNAGAARSGLARYSDDIEERNSWRAYKDREDAHLFYAASLATLIRPEKEDTQ